MTMTMEILRENDTLRTSDLSLAATLYLSVPLLGINKQNLRRAEFLFERTQELNGLIEQFWHGDLKVDPRAYFDALRAIKARLYDR